jgi:hypothetical protein
METELITDPLQPDEAEAALDYAASTGLFSPAQIASIRERVNGFVSGQLVDYFQALACWRGRQIRGFLLYRQRPLTHSTFEIGFLVVHPGEPPTVLATLVHDLNLPRSLGATLLFVEIPDLPVWNSIRRTLLGRGFETVGRIPHLYQPGIGAVYLLKKIGERSTSDEERRVTAE